MCKLSLIFKSLCYFVKTYFCFTDCRNRITDLSKNHSQKESFLCYIFSTGSQVAEGGSQTELEMAAATRAKKGRGRQGTEIPVLPESQPAATE